MIAPERILSLAEIRLWHSSFCSLPMSRRTLPESSLARSGERRLMAFAVTAHRIRNARLLPFPLSRTLYQVSLFR